MRLQLKEGWTRHISQVPGDKGAVIICAPGATQRSDYAHIVDCIGTPLEENCGVYARANGGPSCTATFQTREDAHKWLLSVGSDSPWQEVSTTEELTAAAEGEGPEAPPAPRLCALDRLVAAGFVTRLCDEWVALYNPDLRGIMVSIKPTRLAGCFRAKLFDTTSDESPGLNAALESLLSKPVGAVTVAQILGVA